MEKVNSVVTCPKCGKSIPAWKLMFLTNFNTITCPTCSAKLRANKRISSLIGDIWGGVGGGLGCLLVHLCFDTKAVVYLMLIIALFPLICLSSLANIDKIYETGGGRATKVTWFDNYWSCRNMFS